MARLRKFTCYRGLERPYTRKSKYSKLSYVKVIPASRISRHEIGNPIKRFRYSLLLKSMRNLQIRHNALEAGRLSANKLLETHLGKDDFFLKLRVYPHHVLRENPLATGAGADRMSTGMAHSFGKAISVAAQVKRGQSIVEVDVDEEGLKVAKDAMQRFGYKLPSRCTIEVIDRETGKRVVV